MSPSDFAKFYWKLDTFIYPFEGAGGKAGEPNLQTLSLHGYRLGSALGAIWQQIQTNMGKQTTFDVKVCTRASGARVFKMSIGEIAGHVKWAYAGKGSPEQAQIAVQMTYRFYQPKVATRPQMLLDAQSGGMSYVGLDCNGFVGNYILDRSGTRDWTTDWAQDPTGSRHFAPDYRIRDIFDSFCTSIDSLEQITNPNLYVLVQSNDDGLIYDHSDTGKQEDGTIGSSGHIMITDTGTIRDIKLLKDRVECDVVESTFSNAPTGGNLQGGTSPGLRKLRYVIKAKKGNVFQVQRGPGVTSWMPVRIGRLR